MTTPGRAGPSTPPPRRRPRRAARPFSLSPAPSASLLSLLATVAASVPAAAGSPAPLAFLCPRYVEPVAEQAGADDSGSPFGADVLLAAASASKRATRGMAVKYESKEDGKWRKADSYSLYGSTICSSCEASSSVVEDAAAATSTAAMDAAATSATSSDILDTLPSGWLPNAREPKTTLIVTLSLVLAFVICFLIMGCLFWRRRVRRKREHDIEMRRRRDVGDDDEEALTDRGVRRKKKIWARATARWKANARVRQRRGKRNAVLAVSPTRTLPHIVDPPQSEAAHGAEERADTLSYVSSSRPVSRQSSRRSASTASEVRDPVVFESPSSPTGSNESLSIAAHPPPVVPPPASSPPAYHNPRPSIPIIHISTSSLDLACQTSDKSIASPQARSRRPSHSSSSPFDSADDSLQLPYPPSAAHIATDDKALLARLTESASHPPPQEASGHHHQESSAPVWEDEDLDDFDACSSSSQHAAGESSQSTAFPPPSVPVSSAKGKMAAEYYSYSLFDEDIQGLEPELGPSAPPFEAVASAPPLLPPEEGELGLAPSAPALEDVDDEEPSTPSEEHAVVVSPPHYDS